MVEQGFVQFVTTRLAALTPPVGVPGGFAVQLPKDLISPTTPKAWSYRSITSTPTYALNAQLGWTEWTVQIDCHGYAMADSMVLARAIEKVLRDWTPGTFPDPDSTFVHGIFRQDTQVDGFSDSNRSFVRSLEFTIQYEQV